MKKSFPTMQSCTVGKRNVYCYSAQGEEVEDAHKAGLSYGKYKAFLEVQELDPNITVSEIQHMTMREIRELIDELSQNVRRKGVPQTRKKVVYLMGTGTGADKQRKWQNECWRDWKPGVIGEG